MGILVGMVVLGIRCASTTNLDPNTDFIAKHVAKAFCLCLAPTSIHFGTNDLPVVRQGLNLESDLLEFQQSGVHPRFAVFSGGVAGVLPIEFVSIQAAASGDAINLEILHQSVQMRRELQMMCFGVVHQVQ